MTDITIKPGQPWGDAEKQQWLKEQTIKRSYQEDVVGRIHLLGSQFDVRKYGSLSHDPARYPLFALLSQDWNDDKPIVLVTGGVHGYETSGVHGALAFAERKVSHYKGHYNFIVLPCLSPWGYETINRWNPNTDDPNRSFKDDGTTEESSQVYAFLKPYQSSIIAHFDLHETTDTDNTVFRPAKAARDGEHYDEWQIPDGYYTVDNAANPQPDFQKAIIDSVRRVTHIAEADEKGQLIGIPKQQEGVITIDTKALGLCAGLTDAKYVTTTEVYPDSDKVNDAICVDAQVAAVSGGLEYLTNR